MSALNPIPERERLQAVLMQREGLGWAVGVGGVLAGRIERERSVHLDEHAARAAALMLSDRLDLLVLRS